MNDEPAQRAIAAAVEVAKELVGATGDLTRAASSAMRSGAYDVDAYAADLTKLFAGALNGGLRVLAAAAGTPVEATVPAAPDERGVATVVVDPAPHVRGLQVAATFTRVGGGRPIPDGDVTFDPVELAAGATQFRVVVEPAGVAVALYEGRVRVGPPDDGLLVDVDLVL